MRALTGLGVPPALALRLASTAEEAALLLRVAAHAADVERALTAYAAVVGAAERLGGTWERLWATADRALLAAAPAVADGLQRCGARGGLLARAAQHLERLHALAPLLRCYADAGASIAYEMQRADASVSPDRTKRLLAARLEVRNKTQAGAAALISQGRHAGVTEATGSYGLCLSSFQPLPVSVADLSRMTCPSNSAQPSAPSRAEGACEANGRAVGGILGRGRAHAGAAGGAVGDGGSGGSGAAEAGGSSGRSGGFRGH